MRNPKKRTTPGTKAKRGFAVLDREEALKAAAGAVGILRELSRFSTGSAAWRCGLGNALDLLEAELKDILLVASSSQPPEPLFCDGDADSVPADLGKARKDAAGAVKVVQRILRDARADLSVDASQCNGLDNALALVEQELNNLLPPPGAPPRAKLPFGDDGEGLTVESDSESGAEMKS